MKLYAFLQPFNHRKALIIAVLSVFCGVLTVIFDSWGCNHPVLMLITVNEKGLQLLETLLYTGLFAKITQNITLLIIVLISFVKLRNFIYLYNAKINFITLIINMAFSKVYFIFTNVTNGYRAFEQFIVCYKLSIINIMLNSNTENTPFI